MKDRENPQTILDPEKKDAIKERRRFPRRTCRLEAQVTMVDSSLQLSGTITDISVGGCYVEMLSPLPLYTRVELSFTIANLNLHIRGQVRTSQSGFGMGLAFTDMSKEHRETLRRFAEPDSKRSNVAPPVVPTETESRVLRIGNALEAVVRVLLRKGLVTKEELADEFEKLKRQ